MIDFNTSRYNRNRMAKAIYNEKRLLRVSLKSGAVITDRSGSKEKRGYRRKKTPGCMNNTTLRHKRQSQMVDDVRSYNNC